MRKRKTMSRRTVDELPPTSTRIIPSIPPLWHLNTNAGDGHINKIKKTTTPSDDLDINS